MPGAAHRFAHQQAFGQWPAIVGAGGADGKHLIALARQQHGLAIGMAEQHRAIGNAFQRNALGEVVALQGGWGVAHGSLL